MSRSGAGNTIQIVHRACLQSGDRKTVPDHHPHYTGILRRDHNRVRSIHRRLTGAGDTAATIPASLGLAFHSLEYVVTIGIGTPARNFTVLFDTGSDLTWVQCKPCTDSCYQQQEPLFDPSKSSTYVDVPCGTPQCKIGGGQDLTCGGTTCEYSVKYGDQSVTRGNLAQEAFTLSPSAPPAAGVVFGCSHEYSSGVKGAEEEMSVAGLLGLGRGDSSILSQTRRGNSGDVFSYCLPPRGSSAGYLTIGAAAPPQSNLSFTPLVTDNSQLSSVYVVNLVGISVSGAALPIDASAFYIGTVIDSGTVITHMPAAAYYVLRDEFRRHMGGYTMLPEGHVESLDTCYDVTGHDVVTAPPVALEFGGGARIDVDASGILLVFAVDASGQSLTLACLAFVPTNLPGFVIIGNMQQRAYNVVFDVEGRRIGFGANGCS